MLCARRLALTAFGISLLLAGTPLLACSLGNWSKTTGAQGLQAGGPGDGLRRFEGRCSLRVALASSPRYVQDDTPDAETEYLVRFYVFPGELALDDDGWVEVFTAYRGSTNPQPEFGVRLKREDGALAVSARARDGGGFTETEPVVVDRGWRGIEVHWKQSTGPSNGELRLFVDGVERAELRGLANRDGLVNLARLGAVDSSGAEGSLDFDAFVSHRDTPIGALTAGDANGDSNLNAADLVALVREINGQTLAEGQPDCNRDGTVNQSDITCLANAIVQR